MTPPSTIYGQRREQAWLEFAERMDLTVAALEAKIADCHNERACPKCRAGLGERCHSLARCSTARPHPIKHPHRERWGVPVQAAEREVSMPTLFDMLEPSEPERPAA